MLTKSDLLSFLQCPRKLWLEHNEPARLPANDATSRRRMLDGNAVSEKDRQQLGKNLLWPPSKDDPKEAALEAKKLILSSPDRVAVEVHMAHGDLYARADALIPKEAKYVLRETKASSFPAKKDGTPAEPEEHHLNDAAIQTWVMDKSGLPISHIELNYLNSRWRYSGGDDYSGLFRQFDVTPAMVSRVTQVPVWFEQAQKSLAGPMPSVVTGKHCSSPYECPFLPFCEPLDPEGPEHPIELLPDSAGKKLAKKLRETKGYTSILEPAPEELAGSQADLYRRIQAAHRCGQAIFEDGSDLIMASYGYPRYYFDFEGINLPVPHWVGTRPYEQIPFQWSCHIERSPGVFEHAEFLDLTGNDPSLPCIESMRAVIGQNDGGPIFVYHATYERGRLEEFAERHPEHAGLLRAYIDRLVDLLPIVKNNFYHPQMRGSFSIKKVLPVIAPELNYGALDEVQDGSGAQNAYIEAALDSNTTAERKADIKRKLCIYCRQDTWAMVEIAYFLEKRGRPVRPQEV